METQEQLMQLLAERGFACTQATVSRDIKQLHLIKAPDGKGGPDDNGGEGSANVTIKKSDGTVIKKGSSCYTITVDSYSAS